ncbi:MAG: type II/IV secretion system protein [Candidatus Pacebacteria bacterium]|nr:type II/IV secretion system protein [Candidatus Paceibacterota bacterium]
MINFNDDKQAHRVEELHLKEAEELAEVLAVKYGVPYLDLSKTSINTDALRLIPEDEARAAHVALFKTKGKELYMVSSSPTSENAKAVVADLESKNFKVTLYVCSEASLRRAWGRYSEIVLSTPTDIGIIQISNEAIAEDIKNLKSLADIQESLKEQGELTLKGSGITGIVEMILSGALVTEASDIHIEPQENAVRLRYRLDGVLEDIVDLDRRVYQPILSRLKLVSGLKLNVKQSAQDGRFSIGVGANDMEIRTSILPGAYGESVVLRVLNPNTIRLKFEDLGIEPMLLKIFNEQIRKPNGVILLTGPTGSGKTTTLYSFLREINSTESKIITIEDPIEYHLPGINQTQVNQKKGYTFLTGLRSALRQDPDIIMVGEIRDGETAKIAINSALTGHLVFSTLHTNNAAGTIPRLIDLGINPKIMSAALNVSVAQRLVRKLCPHCKKEVPLTTEDSQIILPVVESIKKKRPELAPAQTKLMYIPVGCERCNNMGYKGRIGLFEAILMDEAVATAAINNPSEKEIKTAAVPQKILDLRQDAIIKVLRGETSLEEVSRVVDLTEEVI